MLSPGIFLFSVPQVSFHRPTLNNDPPWPSIIANIVHSPYMASHLDLTWRRLQVMTEPSEHGQTLVWKMHPCRIWHVVFENGVKAGTYLHTEWRTEPITSGTLHPRRCILMTGVKWAVHFGSEHWIAMLTSDTSRACDPVRAHAGFLPQKALRSESHLWFKTSDANHYDGIGDWLIVYWRSDVDGAVRGHWTELQSCAEMNTERTVVWGRRPVWRILWPIRFQIAILTVQVSHR